MVIYLCLVIVTTIAFVLESRCRLLGSYWSSSGQLGGLESQIVMEQSGGTTDGEVKRRLRATGLDRIRVSVAHREPRERYRIEQLSLESGATHSACDGGLSCDGQRLKLKLKV